MALLVALVTTFAVRPLIGDVGVGPIVFSIAGLFLLMVALYTTQVEELVGDREVLLVERKRRRLVGWMLAVPAIAGRLAGMVVPSPPLYLAESMCLFVFFSFVTWSELRSVLKHREVTSETISMSISVYLLFGVTWGVLYSVLFQCQPDAFSFAADPSSTSALADNPQHIFPVFIYFSLTTLSTIGFGDITPLTLQARYAAVAEGITGQFYLAILVARLVGIQMSQAANQDTRNQTRIPETERSVDRDR